LNYYNYFTEIEDTFIRRRGRNLLLSPIDWAMIESWQQRGIPLHIVLRGIEAVFDNFDKNPKPRTIKSLIFCREEIEAQYQEWSSAQVGKNSEQGPTSTGDAFSRESIEQHIDRVLEKMEAVTASELAEDAGRAKERLRELRVNLTDVPEQIDLSLCDIENFLDQALLSKTEKQHLNRLEKETATQMRAYKSEMEKDAYETTFRLMMLKRLREDHAVPRMSLFYL
jgi:hypothetical protein